VAYHQQVLDAIDHVLEPNAKNAELKALIANVRPVIASHLQHAKLIQTQLAGGPPAALRTEKRLRAGRLSASSWAQDAALATPRDKDVPGRKAVAALR